MFKYFSIIYYMKTNITILNSLVFKIYDIVFEMFHKMTLFILIIYVWKLSFRLAPPSLSDDI